MRKLFATTALITALCAVAPAADWPQWRRDARRSGISSEDLSSSLHLRWVRKYPPLRPAHWQIRQIRQQFDLGYEPVVEGGRVFVASSRNDSVTALSLSTGAELWRFYADAPVRLAPVVHNGRVMFGADDGRLYCVSALNGSLLWRHRGCPSRRKVLGNGRMISVWPARGGAVARDGNVYFAAGLWPFEGIFVWAVDALTGKTVWLNDRTGSLYLKHPHGAMSFGGPSPQGYLAIHRNELIVPSGRAFPAFFDLETGALNEFEFGHGAHGSRPGSWFLTIAPDGEMHVDPEINRDAHDEGLQRIGQKGGRGRDVEKLADRIAVGTRTYHVTHGAGRKVTVGHRSLDAADGFPGVTGTIHTMLAANGCLLVVTREGGIHCLSGVRVTPRFYQTSHVGLPNRMDAWAERADEILDAAGRPQGYALVLGLGTGRLTEELLLSSQLHVVAVDTDAKKVDAFRRRLDRAGLYGTRVAAFAARPGDLKLPPYFASLVTSEDVEAAKRLWPDGFAQSVFRSLRPYGGRACVPAEAGDLGSRARRVGELLVIERSGPLPGAADYSGLPNFDDIVRGPLGVLWFGDTHHHHKLFSPDPATGFIGPKGSGLPQVMHGAIRYHATLTPYGTQPTKKEAKKTLMLVHTDLYTGRDMDAHELPPLQPEGERPTSPRIPRGTTRVNPITGVREARNVIKGYGCDATPRDYGNLYTMRSGTAAYYDKRSESGTVNISGLRSGCRNNIIPAGGVLALPYWVGNCTCNYPNHTSLALTPMPDGHEQWAAWGPVAVEAPVRRLGLNFGAPGDRAAADGTLWIEVPSVGGPSPDVDVAIGPSDVKYNYRHSAWMRGGDGSPWVASSRVEGIRSLKIVPIAHRPEDAGNKFSVRWMGELVPAASEETTFHAETSGNCLVWIDDKLVLDNRVTMRPGRLLPAAFARPVALTAGRPVALTVEYTPTRKATPSQSHNFELSWSSASVARSVIPGTQFRAIDGKPGGITGAYYRTEDLKGPGALNNDRKLAFDWGNALPAPLVQGQPLETPSKSFTVRMVFAELAGVKPQQRVFSVVLQGREVLKDFDIAGVAGGSLRGVVKEFRGVRVEDSIDITFTPTAGEPVLSGLELLAE